MFVSIYHLFTTPGKGEERQDFGQFIAELKDKHDQIDKVVVQPHANNQAKYIISYRNTQRKVVAQGEYFEATLQKFRDYNVNYAVEKQEESTIWASILIQWLPMVFL